MSRPTRWPASKRLARPRFGILPTTPPACRAPLLKDFSEGVLLVAHRACFRRCSLLVAILSLAWGAAWTTAAWGAAPSEQLLPATTKGYLSTRDVDQVREKFQATTLGQLVNDPL